MLALALLNKKMIPKVLFLQLGVLDHNIFTGRVCTHASMPDHKDICH